MSTTNPALTILLADDDEEDRSMTIEALREHRVALVGERVHVHA